MMPIKHLGFIYITPGVCEDHKGIFCVPSSLATLWENAGTTASAFWGWLADRDVAFWGSLASIIVLLILVYVEWIRPRLRDRKLKWPVKGHFTIRQTPDSDIEPHHVQTLVLRSHSATEIEIGIHARTVFHAREVIFGFKGNRDAKPVVTGRARQFVKSGNLPDQTYYVDHADWCHAVIDRDFNRGTHIVMGFAVQTRQPGRYEVQLSFVTDEIEGNYERLAVLVEDDPQTIMSCHAKEHTRGCTIDPATLPQPHRPPARKPRRPRPKSS